MPSKVHAAFVAQDEEGVTVLAVGAVGEVPTGAF